MAGVANDLNSELGGSNSNSAVGADGVGGSGVSVVSAHSHAGRSAAVVPLRTGGTIAGIIPSSIEEVFRLATAIAKSGMAPRDMGTPEKLTVAILHGLEIGIPPMMAINKIAVVNGRPTLWGDAVPALLLSKGFRLREETGRDEGGMFATATVIRPNGEQITRVFSEEDAKVAGLWGKQGPWKQYPSRMLQMRARGLAARDGAADVLSGIYLAEEAQDIAEPMPTAPDLMPSLAPVEAKRMSSAAAKRDGIDVALNELRGAVSGADTLAELEQIKSANQSVWDAMPYSWAQLLEAEYQDKANELQQAAE